MKHRRIMMADSYCGASHVVSWAPSYLILGARLARHSHKLTNRQLVVALSAPKRDYVACLIGCGWILGGEAPAVHRPLDVFRGLARKDPVRVVTKSKVISDFFISLDEERAVPRVTFAGSEWFIDGILAANPLDGLDGAKCTQRPSPGSMERMAELEMQWDARLAKPSADLSIVGTKLWLQKELETFIFREGESETPSTIGGLLMPKYCRSATWFTNIYSSTELDDTSFFHWKANATILDGTASISYLADIDSSIVVCVIDRSVMNESSGDLILQLLRNAGEPISLSKEINWKPAAGVEALSFMVRI